MRDNALCIFRPLMNEPMKLDAKDTVEHKCACGKPATMFEADPYASEIHGDDTPMWQCDDCNCNSAMDIYLRIAERSREQRM